MELAGMLGRSASPARLRARRWLRKIGFWLSVFVIVSPAILVFLWMLSLSLKTEIDNIAYPPVFIPAEPYFEDQFSFWPRYDELIDFPPGYQRDDTIYTEEHGYNPFRTRTALYITDRDEEKAPSSIKQGFESWEMIACIDQTRRGLPLRQLRIFACRNYLDPGVK